MARTPISARERRGLILLAAAVLIVAGAGFMLDRRNGNAPQPSVAQPADTAAVVITDSAPQQPGKRKHKRHSRKGARRNAAKSLPAAPPRDFLADTIPIKQEGAAGRKF